jgi:uncharacterized LabA/DUF88 family protein
MTTIKKKPLSKQTNKKNMLRNLKHHNWGAEIESQRIQLYKIKKYKSEANMEKL